MDPAALSAAFIAFALAMYAVLDGFDLGVGALLLFEKDELTRDQMVTTIAPAWDGNETWLIMAAIVLLAAFPRAYGILVPAFYIPVIIMLLALGLRGIAFEFRMKSIGRRPSWDRVFTVGSLLAGFMQGCIVGGLIQGIKVQGDQFAGSPFDVFSPFSFLCGVGVVLAYIQLGAGWLHHKGLPLTDLRGHVFARAIPVAFALLAAAAGVAAVRIQPQFAHAWSERPLLLGALALVFIAVDGASLRYMGARRSVPALAPFGFAALMLACGFTGLLVGLFPYIVPFTFTLWQVAAPASTQMFLLSGVAAVTPVVLAYLSFSYWVFRGPTPKPKAT